MVVGICDDEIIVRESLEKYVSELLGTAKCVQFSSGDEILHYYLCPDKPEIDILLLDLAMTETDGMVVAETIQAKIKEKEQSVRITKPLIIFVTGIQDRMAEAFNVNAFDYIVKPINKDKFKNTVLSAAEEIKRIDLLPNSCREENHITIKNGGTTFSLNEEDIVCIESVGRKVVIHALGRKIEIYGKIGEWEQNLGDTFFRVHKSYLVNMKHVKKYTRGDITMASGQQALLSKYRYNDFVQSYMNYIADRES